MSKLNSKQLSYPLSGSFTGSLFGTSSYALDAVSASFATSASRAISSSFSITASYALNAGTTINTGSFVTTSSFNSYTGSTTSQFAGTSSFALTSSYAITASYAMNGGGGSSSPSNLIFSGSVTASVDVGDTTFRIISGSALMLFISSSGNIGIGTNTPAYKLDVASDINYAGDIYGNGIIGVPHKITNFNTLSNYTASTEGIYLTSDNNPTTYTFQFPDPTLVPNRKIIIVNVDPGERVAISSTNQPRYQGTRQASLKLVDSVPALSVMEFISADSNWRSMAASSTPTFNSLANTGGDVSFYIPGIYRITNAAGTDFFLMPDPLQHEGERITIINSADDAASFGGTYIPVDAADATVGLVPANEASEFVSINGYWYKV